MTVLHVTAEIYLHLAGWRVLTSSPAYIYNTALNVIEMIAVLIHFISPAKPQYIWNIGFIQQN